MAHETTERAAPRRSRGPSLLRWLYGSGLFAIGACLGVVIGSVSETPRLLLERMRGPVETLEVAAPAAEAPELESPSPSLERFGELQEGTPPAPPSKPPLENVAPVPDVAPAPVAAAPPAAKPEVAAPAPEPRPRPAAPAAPAPSAGSRPVVQVASHVDKKPADELAAKLRAQGFDAYVSRPSAQSGRFRVRVRPSGGETPAALAKRLKGDGYDTWATSE